MISFEEWLVRQGLSDRSVRSYHSAIKGVISAWAKRAMVVDQSLLEIRNGVEFEAILQRIVELPIYIERNTRGKNMYGAALNRYRDYLEEIYVGQVEADLDAIFADQIAIETEKIDMVKCRLGQGDFRKNLFKLWEGCSVTAFQNRSFLVASHIKPWSECNSVERMDPYNGFLLIPNLDKAFDLGFITFSEDGLIKLSPDLFGSRTLSISEDMRIDLKENNLPYLEYHQEHVFRA
jgi:hypothetical protein